MENKWTFSYLDEKAWEQGIFDTKDEAIEAAKELFETGCIVGQLEIMGNGYKVVNQEEIIFV